LAIAANAQKGNSPGGKDCQKENPVIPKDPSVQFNPDNVKWPCDFGNKPIPMGPAPEGCSKYEVIIGQCPVKNNDVSDGRQPVERANRARSAPSLGTL
jgi:hypothetical protein